MASESQLPYRQVNICASLEMTTKWIPARHPKCSTIVENPLQIGLFMQNKANLRKSQVDVSIFSQKAYENKSDWTLSENKPNSKPNKVNLHFTAENAEYAEKKDISVSYCSIERYALYHISPCSLRTRQLMENKPNSKPIKANFKRDDGFSPQGVPRTAYHTRDCHAVSISVKPKTCKRRLCKCSPCI